MCEPAQSDEYASALVALCSRLTLYILAGCVTLGIFLASQVHVDRIVTATGQLITREPTIIVQTLNRAIISSINVREGDRVKAGDVLATLDPTFAAATALGLLHIDGRGVDRDPVTARILLVGPARRGNGFAQAGLKRLRLLAGADAAPFIPRATAG